MATETEHTENKLKARSDMEDAIRRFITAGEGMNLNLEDDIVDEICDIVFDASDKRINLGL